MKASIGILCKSEHDVTDSRPRLWRAAVYFNRLGEKEIQEKKNLLEVKSWR